jgi:hypothetical protein
MHFLLLSSWEHLELLLKEVSSEIKKQKTGQSQED